MKTRRTNVQKSLVLLFACHALVAAGQTTNPVITSCRVVRANLVVTAEIPPGLRSVTLEGTDHLGRLSWAPLAVTNLDGTGTTISFRMPMSGALEMIRIKANPTTPLPAAFFRGTNGFSAPSDSTSGGGSVGITSGPVAGNTPSGSGPTSARQVVESDIWEISGTTLYFFNQYRGLQVIDISNPDASVLRGTLALAAAGDQMYLLSSNEVVLLAREGCDYDQSQALIVAATNGSPSIVATLPFPGTMTESRLVGTALYVASQTYQPVAGTTNSSWEWGTLVSAFDLSNPAAPEARNTLWFPGYGDVVSATDKYFFVATQGPTDWWQTVVNLVDITDPSGTMSAYGSITAAGEVLNKYNLDYSGTVFSAISEDWNETNDVVVTRLQTYTLPDPRSAGPAAIVKLGELDFGPGETLNATRFDSNRVYVVTSTQSDPLWVVDLSNPSAPQIAGSVAVPGWSTYIEPLGARLITLGIETNQVAVSLFDVTDAQAPSLLSRVLLGTNYSWSQANWDDQAFTVLADAGLLLVPYSGSTSNGYASVLQLINYSTNALSALGQVQSDSGLSYLRATVFDNRILSLNDWELDSINPADPHNPFISGRLILATEADQIVLSGDYLIELSDGNGWTVTAPSVSVEAIGAPDQPVGALQLGALPLLGATKHDGRLYIAQGTTFWDSAGTVSNANFVLTVVSLTNLPTLTVLAESVSTNIGPIGWSSDWHALWPGSNVLVWVGGQDSWWWCQLCPLQAGPIPGTGLVGAPGPVLLPYWRGNGSDGHLVAFDATNPNSPQLASQIDLTDTNWWGFSPAFVAQGLVYLSHQTSQFVPDPNPTNGGTWVFQTFLHVVDFASPYDPLVRTPVNIANQLQGVDTSGALLFTVGTHWNSDPNMPWREYLDASAYDGVAAFLVDSMPLSTNWPHPVLVLGTNVLVADPGGYGASNAPPPTLATWALSGAGKFVRLGSVSLGSPVSDLTSFGDLAATANSDSTVDLFDATDPEALKSIGAGLPPLCWWWPDLREGDGSLTTGLWLPLGPYGASLVSVSQ